jgi:hypothetical protein
MNSARRMQPATVTHPEDPEKVPMSEPNTIDGRVVVHVRDEVNCALAGHDGREYTSPPHQRIDALTLVALLLGAPAQPDGRERSAWSCPLAGGRRMITLSSVDP